MWAWPDHEPEYDDQTAKGRPTEHDHQRNRRLHAASSKAALCACASSIAFMRIWIATTGSQHAPASIYKA